MTLLLTQFTVPASQLLIQEFIVAKDAGTKWLPMPETHCLLKTTTNTVQAKATLNGVCSFMPKLNNYSPLPPGAAFGNGGRFPKFPLAVHLTTC